MLQHPIHIEQAFQFRYSRLKDEATINQRIGQIQKPKITIPSVIAVPLGDLLINVGLKLTGNQVTT